MRKRFNILIDKRKPTSEEITQHKDFDALLKQYESSEQQNSSAMSLQNKNTQRWRLIATSFILIALTTIVLKQTVFRNDAAADYDDADNYAQSLISPPLKNLENKYYTFEVDAAKGGEFLMKDSTKLVVPQNAFADEAGNILSGKILMQYQRFLKTEDVFIAGIPLQYDSAGVNYDLTAGGLIELKAKSIDSHSEVKLQKPISIILKTQAGLNPNVFQNIYKLDTIVKNWEYKGDNILEVDVDEATANRVDEILADNEIIKKVKQIKQQQSDLKAAKTSNAAQLQKPTPPRVLSETDLVLNLDLSKLDNTMQEKSGENLSQYEGIFWGMSDDQKVTYKKATNPNITWTSANLVKVNDISYHLKLSNGQTNVELNVFPILMGEQLAKAEAKYQRELAAYNAQLAENTHKTDIGENLDIERNAKIEELEQELAQLENAYNKLKINTLKQMNVDFNKHNVICKFSITSLGIWNCGKPILRDKRTIEANFQNSNGDKIEFERAYVVDKTNQHIQRFYTKQSSTILFDPNAENSLWLVTQLGQIAVVETEEFLKINDLKKFTFTIDRILQQPENTEQVKQFLNS